MGMAHSSNPAQGMTPAQLANAPHSAANMSIAQMAAQAQSQFNSAYSQYAQQGLTQAISAQQYANMLSAQQAPRTHHMWVWNGVPMDVVDFAQHAYGDTPEATHFILKYKETA